MHDFIQDVRYGLRMLVKMPVVMAIAAVSLALGIAANTTTFSVANGFLLAPFPYPDQDELLIVFENHRKETNDETVAPGNFLDFEERSTVFENVVAYDVVPANLTGGETPERVRLVVTSPEVFAVLGASPLLGRDFEPGEGVAGAGDVVILSNPFWRRYFGEDRSVLGRSVRLDGVTHTIIGVLPETFDFLPANVDLFRPSNWQDRRNDRDDRSLFVIGRLKDGRTKEEAQAELSGISAQLEKEYPEANEGYGVRAIGLREYFPGRTDTVLQYILLTVSGFVLLIACANIANLLLARAEGRQREVAVRTALGAGRVRILRQLLTESVLLALIGGAMGTVLSVYAVRGVATAMPAELPRSFMPVLDGTVLVFTLAVSMLAGMIFGVAPALHSFAGDLREALGENSRGGTASRKRNRLRSAFVVAELAAALALLVASGTLVKIFDEVILQDPGVRVEGVLTAQLTASEDRHPDDEAVRLLYRDILARLGETPGIQGVAAMIDLPRSRNTSSTELTIDGRAAPQNNEEPRSGWQAVNAAYFDVLEVPILSGRAIAESDRYDTQPVAVVSESFVEAFFPDEDPLGRQITVLGKSRQVVGVSRNVFQTRMPEEGGGIGPQLYLPLEQVTSRNLSLAMPVSGDPDVYAPAVRAAIWAVDPEQPVNAIETLQAHIDTELAGPWTISFVLGIFGVLALLLSAIGVYGVMAHSVVQRHREIGIRMALGAASGDVTRLVTRQGLKLVLLGLLIGAPIAVVLVRAIRSALFSTSTLDISLIAGVVATLVGVAFLATYLPARRASHLSPVRALGTE